MSEALEPPRAAAELAARRERIADTALRTMLWLGFVAYVPSAWLCIRTHTWSVLAVDTVAYVAVLLAYRIDPRRYDLRGAVIVALCLALGTTLCIVLGVIGAGPLWLVAAPVVASLIFERRNTLMVLALTAAITLAILLLLLTLHLDWAEQTSEVGLWLMMSGNIIAVASVLAVGVASLINGLRASAERAEQIGVALAAERTQLIAANERLRQEMQERQHAETQLRQAEKLSAIGTLAGGIAHDINNLLTPILSAAELLREEERDGSVRAELLDRMLDGARGGKELVRRILAFSRPVAEGRAPHDAAAVFGDAARLLRATLPAVVDVAFHAADDSGAVLLTTAEANQLVLNLGINAHHAMPHGGTLAIMVDEPQATSAPDDARVREHRRFVRLSVRDTGTGMDEETRRRAFEPFFTTREGGTGIGLATVHAIVQSAGGWIECDSTLQLGTTIRVHLPRVEPATARAPRAHDDALPNGEDRHVLVVDDEHNVRTIAARVLQRAGYRVSLAASAEEAQRILEQQEHDVSVVLSDLMMPGGSGLELAGAMRDITPDTPIVLMSGLADAELQVRAADAGVSGIIAKPFENRTLLRTVADALEPCPANTLNGSVPAH